MTEKHMIREGFKISALSDGAPTSIALELEDGEWVNLIDMEESPLGICCGIISDMRDIFIDALRNDRMLQTYELHKLANLATSHTPWSEYDDDYEDEDDLIWRLVRLWDKIKGDCKTFGPHGENPNDPKDALDAVASMSIGISFEMLMTEPRPHCVLWQIAQMWPFLKTLHDKIEKLAPLPIEGWAALDEKGGLASTYGGPALYQTEEALDKMLKNNPKMGFRKKKVRISAKGGLEIIADPEPWERADTVIVEANEVEILGDGLPVPYKTDHGEPTYVVSFPDDDGGPVEANITKKEFERFPHAVREGTRFGIVLYRVEENNVVTTISRCWPVSKFWHPNLQDQESRLRRALAKGEMLSREVDVVLGW